MLSAIVRSLLQVKGRNESRALCWRGGGNSTIPKQDAEKVRQRRSRIAQTLNVRRRTSRISESRRGFSVRQDPFKGRTAHTKCGLYLLGPSLATALLDGLFEHLAKPRSTVS